MIDDIRTRMVRRYGVTAQAWVAALPDLVAAVAARWNLDVGVPFDDGNSGVTLRVTTAGGSPAVLKVSPDTAFLREQAELLRMFAPSGRVPDVLAASDDAVLLSVVEPGTPVAALPEPPTPAAFGELLNALHSVPVPSAWPHDVRGWSEGFLRRTMDRLADPIVGDAMTRSDVERATAELDGLTADPAPVVLLHGDLHMSNVLDGGARGLVAIDPKSCLGEPAFDAVDYILVGAGRAGGITYRLDAVSAGIGQDPERVLRWCRVAAPAVAVPLLTRGDHGAAADVLAVLRDT